MRLMGLRACVRARGVRAVACCSSVQARDAASVIADADASSWEALSAFGNAAFTLYEAGTLSMSSDLAAAAERIRTARTAIEAKKAEHLFPAFPTLTLGLLRCATYDAGNIGFVRTVLNVAPAETQRLIEGLLPPDAL